MLKVVFIDAICNEILPVKNCKAHFFKFISKLQIFIYLNTYLGITDSIAPSKIDAIICT